MHDIQRINQESQMSSIYTANVDVDSLAPGNIVSGARSNAEPAAGMRMEF